MNAAHELPDAKRSFSDKSFEKTFPKTLPELVDAGKPGSGEIWNCLDIPLGKDRLRNIPHVAGHGYVVRCYLDRLQCSDIFLSTFNSLPFLFNIAKRDLHLDLETVEPKLHWALATVSGAETSQHVDGGGYATVVEVLSGKKLWAVGVRDGDKAFANDTHCLKRQSEYDVWQSIDRHDMRWESMMLFAGDVL